MVAVPVPVEIANAFADMLKAGWTYHEPLTFTADAYRIELDPCDIYRSMERELDRLYGQISDDLMQAAEESAVSVSGIRDIAELRSRHRAAMEKKREYSQWER